MTHIVALEFEAGAMSLTQALQDLFDIRKGIAEDPVTRRFKEWALPRMLEVRITPDHRVHTEIHRTHVQ